MKEKKNKVFKLEIQQLLNLINYSSYSNKDIFFRELITNSFNAINKLRTIYTYKSNLYNNKYKLYIKIFINKKKRTIIIQDNGIGMFYEEVINNFNNIIQINEMNFIKSINSNNKLIKNFNIGFYSSFIVAKKIIICTKYVGLKKENGVFWESNGKNNYTIAYINKINHGTNITLYLKECEYEFLNINKVKSIIQKYFNHILSLIKVIEKK